MNVACPGWPFSEFAGTGLILSPQRLEIVTFRETSGGPGCMLAQHRIVGGRVALGQPPVLRSPVVPECDKGVAAEEARVVPGHEQPVVADAQVCVFGLEPVDERDG